MRLVIAITTSIVAFCCFPNIAGANWLARCESADGLRYCEACGASAVLGSKSVGIDSIVGGMTPTAGRVVFFGDVGGNFYVVDAALINCEKS